MSLIWDNEPISSAELAKNEKSVVSSLVGGRLSDEASRLGAAAEARTAVQDIASQAVSGITSNAPAVTASPVAGFASMRIPMTPIPLIRC